MRSELSNIIPSHAAIAEQSLVRSELKKAVDNMAPICKGYGFVWPASVYFGRVKNSLEPLKSRDQQNHQLFLRCLDSIETEYKKHLLGPPAEVLKFAEALRDSFLAYEARLAPPPPPP